MTNVYDTLQTRGFIKQVTDESAVREAAMVALQAITGQRFGFEPIASPAERAKRVKEWRDWWKRHGDDFLVGS